VYPDQIDTYSTADAARILGLSHRRVQQLAEQGDIEGRKFEGREWRLFQQSVHSYLETHGPGKRGRSRIMAGIESGLEPDQAAREYMDRIAGLERELGRLEGRLELTERAESTMREERERLLEDLDRERERAEQERERAEEVQRDAEQFIREREEAQEEARRLREEQEEAKEEAHRLREELEAERSKGFWRRLFGG
jgi:excisionase family DNA binding protein